MTLATNYFAQRKVCDLLFPILKVGARVVNVSSANGYLSLRIKPDTPVKAELKNKLSSSSLTVEELDSLMAGFVEAAKQGEEEVTKLGWPTSCYAVSKVCQ